jgi:hypothetical protein
MIRIIFAVVVSFTVGIIHGVDIGLIPMSTILTSDTIWLSEWIWWMTLFVGVMLLTLYMIDWTINRWNQVARALSDVSGTRLPVYESDSEGPRESGQSEQRDATQDVGGRGSTEGD